MALIAIVAFLSPLLTSPTEENPTGNAGLFAPVIALCTAAVVLTQAVKAGGLKFQRIPSIFIGVGSMASAYLWIAAEARAHPADPALPGVLLVLLVVTALSTIAIPFLAMGDKPPSHDYMSGGEGKE